MNTKLAMKKSATHLFNTAISVDILFDISITLFKEFAKRMTYKSIPLESPVLHMLI